MVRTFKTALLGDVSKCDEALSIFLLTYRTTPDENGKSPAEKLHGREHRTKFPEKSNKKGKKQTTNKFSINQQVFVRQYLPKKKWVPAVVKKLLGRRMYLVETDTGMWRRHQNQTKPRFEKIDVSSSDHLVISPQNKPRNVLVNAEGTSTQQTHQQATAGDVDIEIYPETSPPTVEFDATPPTDPTPSTSQHPNLFDNIPAYEPRSEADVLRRFERTRKKPDRFTPN
ncbi:uncharacterized protein LOC129921427 [Episyrphus balteatus]|uniref:uncharacterized protein LOC129921427 n=1 Tax=Episyrphus balteatus TaxID=286459 RepID=UPI002486A39A|nr:uncharacterized protein LOC129921427 [Episyrphus balteatus]